MKKKYFLLCFIVLMLTLSVALGMVACNSKEVEPNTPEEEEPDDGGKKSFNSVGEYLNKVHDGLTASQEILYGQEPLQAYAVSSEYTVYTSTENYTIEYAAVYSETDSQNLYYLRLFDNALHINRMTVYYDGKDLYLTADKGNQVIHNFNVSLFFDVFNEFVRKADAGKFLYGSFMQKYISETSPLTGMFGLNDCTYNKVDTVREAITLYNGNVSMLISVMNAYREAYTEGIGDSFDALSYNLLGFRLSRFIEYSFSTVLLDKIQFLLNDGNVSGADFSVSGKMLDNSEYAIKLAYAFDTTTNAIAKGESMKNTYSFVEVSPEKGSFSGTALFPTVREEPFEVALDYDLDSKINANNRFTLRIFDQNSTKTEITDRYEDITTFLGLYYTNEILYIDAEGLCDFIGAPVELESLHLPKVYVTDLDVSSLLQMSFSYLIRLGNVLIDADFRNASVGNKNLYTALLEALSTSEDLSTIELKITEQLVKDIRQDDTSVSVLLSRTLGMPDDTLNKYLGSDFFQKVTVLASYNFQTGEIIFDDYYDTTLYASFSLFRSEFEKITLGNDLNELYYTVLVEPDVVTLEYDAYMTPYETESVDVGSFFGIFIGDSSGKNTSYTLTYEYRLVIRGSVSEYYVTNASGEKVMVTALDLGFYQQSVKTGEEKTLLSVVTNPYDMEELLIGYYMPIGTFANKDGVFYRIRKEAVSEQLRLLTGEDNIFLSQNNLGILLGLVGSVGSGGNAYTKDGQYNITLVTTEDDDPVLAMTGIAHTRALAKVRMTFTEVDLSNVKPTKYSDPYVAEIKDVSAQSIYATDSNWKKTAVVYVSSQAIEMALSYDPESIAIKTDVTTYRPTAYLFGKEISYKVSIVNSVGTYVIQDLLMTEEWLTPSKAYTFVETDAQEVSGETVTILPRYLLVIDPAYTKVLPTSVEVRYDNFLVGTNDCVITGFLQNNITIEGYNLAFIAGEFSSSMPSYTLRIGINSIASCTFNIYVAVLNRSVVSYKKNPVSLNEEIAVVNNEQTYERTVGLETQTGETYSTVVGKETVPVVGVVNVDPYTYAMKAYGRQYNLIVDEIEQNAMQLVFKGYYGILQTKNESGVNVQLRKYYHKEGYSYFALGDVIQDWTFDTSAITWQGGVCYALGYYGDDNGYAVRVAVRVNVMKKDITEVQIDAEGNSTYTIDYLIKSTYEIPTTGQNGHTVRVVFSDGTTRQLIPTRLSSLTENEFYNEYVLGSLLWKGTSGLEQKLSVQGTTSLFGSGRDATSVTTAEFGTGLGVGLQTVSLSVLQPSRYQSLDDESEEYLITRYVLDQNNKYVPEKGMRSVSNAKFSEKADAKDAFEMNPYDYTAALPSTIWLYVYRDTVTRVWKEYDIVWTTTDKEGNELNLVKEANGQFVLAHPSTEERDLVVYGTVGDGKSVIWVTMIVRNLRSELQEVTFYNYSYVPQTGLTGQIPSASVYYEYFEDGKAPTTDKTFLEKSYFTKAEETVQGEKRISYIPYTNFTLGTELPKDVKLYEQITKGYGVTEDSEFKYQKTYYVQNTNTFGEGAVIEIDPYDDYTAKIPTHFRAVLGSGAVVTDEDVVVIDEKQTTVGLTWYVVCENDTTEYPLVRADIFLAKSYDKYYQDGKFLFSYTTGNCGLKCYIKGNTGIANEAVLQVTVDSRTLSVVKTEGKNTSVVDIYNKQEDVTAGQGIYAGTASKGYTGIHRFTEESNDLYERLNSILGNEGVAYIGVAFEGVEDLYSLPVTFDTDSLQRILDFLDGKTMMTEGDTEKVLFLTGKLCKGTVNEQNVSVLFIIRNDMLSSVTMESIPKMQDNGILTIENDTGKDGVLYVSELDKVMYQDYYYGTQYNTYQGITAADSYQSSDYDYVLVFKIAKSYGLFIDRNNYFCTPYEYFSSLFSSMTLTFSDGSVLTDAAAEISLLSSALATDDLAAFFNQSVLGLVSATLGTETVGETVRTYSYSFLELERLAQGSARNKVLIVVKAEKADVQPYEESIVLEPFTNNLTTNYDENGYLLPLSVRVQYMASSGEYYEVLYKTSSWDVETTTLGEGKMSAIPQERIDVVNGAEYRFHYVLPCSEVWCNLLITVAKKDIRSTGYSSSPNEEGKLSITNGVMEITNPFQVIRYDSETNRYLLDESVIPTLIVANAGDYYQETLINTFEITWTTHYQRDDATKSYYLNASVFSMGTSDQTVFPDGMFLFGTYRYSGYYTFDEKLQVSTKKEFTLELYIKIAALSFQSIEVEDDNVSVIASKDTTGNVLYNTIQIDPYEASYDGSYPLPTSLTVTFGSLIPGSTKGTIIRYKFEKIGMGSEFGVTYWLKNTSALDGKGANVSKIGYNEHGHTMSSQYSYLSDDLNTVRIQMGIILGTESNYFTVPVNVYILARIIDKVQAKNIVYRDGEYVYVEEDTYVFYADEYVSAGKEIPTGSYYELVDNRFVLTTDAYFNAKKVYYLKQGEKATAGDTVYYVETKHFEKASGTESNLYKKEKATTVAGMPVSTTYYKEYKVYEKVTKFEAGKYRALKEEFRYTADQIGFMTDEQKAVPTDGTVYYFDEEEGLWFEASGQYKANVSYMKLEAENDYTAKPAATLFKSAVFFKAFAAEKTEYYSVGEITSFVAGQTYYTIEEAAYIPAASADIEYCAYHDGCYTAMDKSVLDETKTYYVFTQAYTYQYGKTYYQTRNNRKTFGNGSYYVIAADENPSVLSYTEDKATGRYVHASSIVEGTAYYTFRKITVGNGEYYLNEEYYEYVGDRYCLTTDTLFNKTKNYYIFRPYGGDGESYYLFEGYEASAYYSYATVPVSLKEKYENNTESDYSEIPVYFIDPYNTASYRLPSEVGIKFITSDSYRTYTVKGWELLDVSSETASFRAFPHYTTDAAAVNEDKGISLYNGSITERFYDIVSGNGKTYYGYYNPTDVDYDGNTYLLRGYIAVGDSVQYFYVTVVVLNRSLKTTGELGGVYSLEYDYDDPIGALLSDIPVEMGESMFVSYDSYYLRYVIDGVSYSMTEEDLFGFNNGNVPLTPTIRWQDTWEYNGTTYDFNALIDTGYEGEIYGSVFAADTNLFALYNAYAKVLNESYNALLYAWMWDKYSISNYHLEAASTVATYNERLEKQVIAVAYTMLASAYSGSNDISEQQRESLLTGTLQQEAVEQYKKENGKDVDLTDEDECFDLIYRIYQSVQNDYLSWKAAGGKQEECTNRTQIYMDWSEKIVDYKVNNTLSSGVDEFKAYVTDYQKLKAAMYLALEKESIFNETEKKTNQTQYDILEKSVLSCYQRDLWDYLYEYASVYEKSIMASVYAEYASDTLKTTVVKSLALQAFLQKEQEGVSGEEAVSSISIPVLTLEKLGGDTEITEIQFSPYNFKSMEKEYTVTFRLNYGKIYQEKIANAIRDNNDDYREIYAEDALIEVENKLKEEAIEDFLPKNHIEGNRYESAVKLPNGKDFTYQNYVEYQETLGSKAYQTDVALWKDLYAYFIQEAQQPISYYQQQGLTNGDYRTAWKNLKKYYTTQSTQEDSDYVTTVLALMAAYNDTTDQQCLYAFQRLAEDVLAYYPVLVQMDESYQEGFKAVVSGSLSSTGTPVLLANELVKITTSASSPYYEVRSAFTANVSDAQSWWGFDQVFAYLYRDIDGFNVAKAISTAFYDAGQALSQEWLGNVPEQIAFCLVNYNNSSIGKLNSVELSFAEVEKGAKELMEYLLWFVVNDGKTPYDYLCRPITLPAEETWYGESTSLFRTATETAEAFEFGGTVCNEAYLESLVDWVMSEKSSDYNKYKGYLENLYNDKDYVGKLGTKESFMRNFARYLVYNLVLGNLSAVEKIRLENLCVYATSEVYEKAVLSLFGNSYLSSTLEEVFLKQASTPSEKDGFLVDPLAEWGKTLGNNAALYSIPSAALNKLLLSVLQNAEKNAPSYRETLQESIENLTETNENTLSKKVLDALANNTSDGYKAFKAFLQDKKGKNVYALTKEDGSYEGTFTLSANFTKYFEEYAAMLADDSEGLVQYFPISLRTLCDGAEDTRQWQTYIVGRLSVYATDYLLRSVEYLYTSMPEGDLRRTVIEEVVTNLLVPYNRDAAAENNKFFYQNGEFVFDERAFIALEVLGSETMGSVLFDRLLLRYDFGLDVETQLQNGYYTFYLTEGMTMLRYEIAHKTPDNSEELYKYYVESGALSGFLNGSYATLASVYEAIASLKTDTLQDIHTIVTTVNGSNYIDLADLLEELDETLYRQYCGVDVSEETVRAGIEAYKANTLASIHAMFPAITTDDLAVAVEMAFYEGQKQISEMATKTLLDKETDAVNAVFAEEMTKAERTYQVQSVSEIYRDIYQDERYRTELDAVLAYIVEPELTRVYKKVKQDLGYATITTDIADAFYTFDAVQPSKLKFDGTVTYYEKDENDWYYLSSDTEANIGTTYYTIRLTTIYTADVYTDYYYAVDTLTEEKYKVLLYKYADEQRYNRMAKILTQNGKSYPDRSTYYEDVYETLVENLIGEKTAIFDAAVAEGLDRAVKVEMYDALSFLTMDAEEFRIFADATSVNDWYRFFAKDTLAGKALEGVEIQYASNWNNVVDALYTFLKRVETYRDVNFDRGCLTTENLLEDYYGTVEIDRETYTVTTDTSAVTQAYKVAYVELLTDNIDFMTNENNSFSLLRVTLQNAYNTLLATRAAEFASITDVSTAGKTVSEILYEVFCTKNYAIDPKKAEEQSVIAAAYDAYYATILEILSHTSVYVRLDLSAKNALRAYLDGVYQEIKGENLNGVAIADKIAEKALGKKTMAYYLNLHKVDETYDYQAVLEELSVDRTVETVFYSADRIDEDDEEALRHVIFFDTNRQDWAEYNADLQEESVTDRIGNGTVAIGNAYKTVETVTVKNRDTFKYLSKYVHGINEYVLTEDPSATQTSILFSNMFFKTVALQLAPVTTIQSVYFEGLDIPEGNYNVIYIDVLNPVFPDSVIAYGAYGEDGGIELGKVDTIEYSAAFGELIFTKDETLEGYEGFSQVFTNDDAFYITVLGDNGAKTKVNVTAQYKDRSIEEIFLYSAQYAAKGAEQTDGVAYSILKNGKNVITIDPINTAVINSAKNGYILPSKMQVVYGNGETGEFSDIVWDASIPFSLDGTGLLAVDILSYRLAAESGYYLIEFEYGTKSKVVMTKYNSDDTRDESIGRKEFSLNGRPDWNLYVQVLDRHVTGIELNEGKVSVKNIVGEIDQNTGKDILVIDISDNELGYINQYCPEYFETIRILFTDKDADGKDVGGKAVEVTLKQSDWASYYDKAYENIITGKTQESKVVTYFNYCGYNIFVRFNTYDISLRNITMLEGGTLYVVYNEASVREQLQKYYSTLYYNFGTAEEPNWKKIQWYPTSGMDDINYRTLGDFGTVYGKIGENSATINENIGFRVEVISPELFASNEGALTNYVRYDYFSYASEKDGKKVTAIAGEPSWYADYFVTSAGSEIHYTVDKNNISYDFINGKVIFPVSYAFDETVSKNIAFDGNGTRSYTFQVTKTLKSYLFTSIQDDNAVSFNKDDTGKRWTWVQTSKFETAVDAVYWTLGQSMVASDLPTLTTTDGLTVYPFWNLNDINVNKANTEGYVIEAHYLISTRTWSSKKLIVYILPEDVSDTIGSYVNEVITEGKSSGKAKSFDRQYDASFYQLQMDTQSLSFLREDGSYAPIPSGNITVEYRKVNEEEIVRETDGTVRVVFRKDADDEDAWDTDEYPINAGYYFIRIRLEDNNVCISDTDSDGKELDYLLYTLIINPRQIDLTDEYNVLFLNQRLTTNNVYEVYDGSEKALELLSWRPMSDTASWGSYDVVYSHADERLRSYIDSIFATVQEERLKKFPDITEAEVKQYIYEKYMVSSALPEMQADNWFGEDEKATLWQKYETDTVGATEAKALAYMELFKRVNDATKSEMTKRYNAQRVAKPKSSDSEIKAAVYDALPETLYLCEVVLHVEYTYGDEVSTVPPANVGSYKVTISILADENNGNYISYSRDTDENGNCYISRVLIIEQDQNVNYEVVSTSIPYNGTVQNPSVYPVCDEDGTVAAGVTITYTYTLSDGVLVVVRTRDGAQIDVSKTTSALGIAGIRDVGSYPVRISVKGSDGAIGNYKDSTVDITTTVRIVPAEIFIEIDDVTSDYLDDVRSLQEFVRVHNGQEEYVCETCGSELNVSVQNGVYTFFCPDCEVQMEVEFSYETVKCYCADCQKNRNNGGEELATMSKTEKNGKVYYAISCPEQGVTYGVWLNDSILCGTDKIADFGGFLLGTDMKEQYPIGSYLTYFYGFVLSGGTQSYTVLDAETYASAYTGLTLSDTVAKNMERFADYKKLVLKNSSMAGSLLKEESKYADLIALFRNYAFYVQENSHYFVQPDEGVLVGSDQELQNTLNAMQAGDSVKIYLEPLTDGNGKYTAYSPIVIGKNGDVNVTLIGYYDITTMDIATKISGITVKNGSLSLEIVNVVVSSKGGHGIEVEKTAGSVRIASCLICGDPDYSYQNTTGIHTNVGYGGKVNVSNTTKFIKLNVAIAQEDGALEIKDSVFNGNAIAINIQGQESDVSIRTSLFMNNSSIAINSVNADVVIRDNRFFFNNIAIQIPEILNDDTYKNTFVAEELCEEMDDIEYIDVDTNRLDFNLTLTK